MAKATETLALTSAWQQLAIVGQSFLLQAMGRPIFLNYSAAEPAADALGHKIVGQDTLSDTAPTEIAWVRSENGNATAVVTKEA